MELIWKKIPNYENFIINQFGVIKNVKNNKEKVLYLKVSKERKNYKRYRVTLIEDKKVSNFYVHKLVAELFVPNPNNYKRISFIDTNSLNIDSGNLRWISDEEFNMMHKGNHDYQFYGNKSKPIIAIHLETNNELEFDSLMEASKFLNTRASYINRVIRGIQKHHKGYTFRYKDVTM